MLALIDKGIWTYRQELNLLGLEVGTRMTLMEIEERQLLAVSPVKMTDSVLRQIEAAGKIRWIVAPNNYHHLYVNSCMRAFPEAIAFAARPLIKKRQDIHFQGVLEGEENYPWTSEVELHLFQPSESYSEALLFHKLSRTLVVTDFVFNLKDPNAGYKRFITRLLKISGGLQMSRLTGFISTPGSILDVLDRVESWRPERLIMAHGEIVEGDIAEYLRQATRAYL